MRAAFFFPAFSFIWYYPFTIDFSIASLNSEQDDEFDDIAKEAYKSVLFIAYFTPPTQDFDDFQEKVKQKSLELFNFSYSADASVSQLSVLRQLIWF